MTTATAGQSGAGAASMDAGCGTLVGLPEPELKRKLQRLSRWSAFCDRRAALVTGGMSREAATRAAAGEFERAVAAGETTRARMEAADSGASAEAGAGSEPRELGTPSSERMAPAKPTKPIGSKKPPSSPPAPKPEDPAPAATPARKSRRRRGGDDESAAEAQSRSLETMTWQQLTMAALGRKCTERQKLEWVFEQMEVPLKLIDADAAPSAGAVSLLRWARESEINKSEFYRQIWPKGMPNQKQASDEAAAKANENRGLKDLLERVRAASASSRAPRPVAAEVAV